MVKFKGHYLLKDRQIKPFRTFNLKLRLFVHSSAILRLFVVLFHVEIVVLMSREKPWYYWVLRLHLNWLLDLKCVFALEGTYRRHLNRLLQQVEWLKFMRGRLNCRNRLRYNIYARKAQISSNTLILLGGWNIWIKK